MDNKESVDFFGDDLTFNQKNLSSEMTNKTIDFMNAERFEEDEKTDVKEKNNVDDFLNFNDESYRQQEDLLKSNPILLPTVEKKDEIQATELEVGSKVQDVDDFLKPNTMIKETNNEKFISSEDLNSDFKDPITTDDDVLIEEIQKPLPTPVSDEPKPKSQPVINTTDSRPVKTQIEAEKIFKSIGLGV